MKTEFFTVVTFAAGRVFDCRTFCNEAEAMAWASKQKDADKNMLTREWWDNNGYHRTEHSI